MEPALVTLGIGMVLGYLAQRSRFCLIGGVRDFLLVRDTELLKGALAFFVTAWLAFSLASVFGLVDFQAPQLLETVGSARSALPLPVAAGALQIPRINWQIWILTAIAGIALGFLSTLANGCPTRQHVLAAQGIQDSAFYLAGFYFGVIVFYMVTRPLIAMFM